MTNLSIFRQIAKHLRACGEVFHKIFSNCLEWQGLRIYVNDGYVALSPLDLPVSVQIEFISVKHLFNKIRRSYLPRFEALRTSLNRSAYVTLTAKHAAHRLPNLQQRNVT